MNDLDLYFHGLDKEYYDILENLKGPIAVFGAGGFIGLNLVKSISLYRDDFIAVTHRPNISWRLISADIPNQNIGFCNLLSVNSIKNFVDKYKPKTIFNLAAYGAYSKQKDESRIYHTNFNAIVNLLKILTEYGFDALVNTGSSSEYGINCAAPEENDELIPNSDYAVAKVSAHYLLKYYGQVLGAPVIHLRLYSVFGPWEDPFRLIPQVIEKGIKKEFPNFVNPDISRDFIYCQDVVNAIIKSSKKEIINNYKGITFNIGSNSKMTIKELAYISKEIFSIESDPVFETMANRKWDLSDWYSNSKDAKNKLEWECKTTFTEGFEKIVEWHKEIDYKNRILNYYSTYEDVPILSVIVVCYNDEDTITNMYHSIIHVFSEISANYEIIFIDDHSTDNTLNILKEISRNDGNVIIVEHTKSFGFQPSLLDGMELMKGDACILTDGAHYDPPELIKEFFKTWQDGYEIVFGITKKEKESFIYTLVNQFFNFLFHFFSFINIHFNARHYSLISKVCIDKILSLPEKDKFIIGLRSWIGFKQKGIYYERKKRAFNKKRYKFYNYMRNKRNAFFAYSYFPLEAMGFVGLILTILAVILIIFHIFHRLANPDMPHGITTILIMIFFFGGIQISFLSFLGEYINNIFKESKSRPEYIRRSITHLNTVYADDKEINDYIKERKII
jgi:dolichol-phosphate mannosyltransferase